MIIYNYYYLMQANNQILDITTAYDFTDMVIRSRNRPSAMSTSASIVRPIFRDSARKKLPIPTAIDDYNHFMGGVDIAN